MKSGRLCSRYRYTPQTSEPITSPTVANATTPRARRGTQAQRRRKSAARSPAVLHVAPARRRQQLEKRAPAVRVAVRELGDIVVPADLELALLHAVIEPRATEHELLQPVDERLALDEGNLVPVANEVPAERA